MLITFLFVTSLLSLSQIESPEVSSASISQLVAQADSPVPSGAIRITATIMLNEHAIPTDALQTPAYRLLVPFAVALQVVTVCQGRLTYNAGNGLVQASKPGMLVSEKIGDPNVTVNGERRPLEIPAILVKLVPYIELRALSELMGAYYAYAGNARYIVKC